MSEIAKSMFLPSGFGALLFLLALAVLVLPKTRRLAMPLLVGSGLVLFSFSTGPVAALLLGPLEHAYPAMMSPERHPEVRTIVVLTAYASDDPAMPLSSRMNSSAAFRVLEAASLAHRRPDCTVIVSGGEVAARVMGAELVALGVGSDRVLLDTGATDTAASAAGVRRLSGSMPVFLVTSAGHMRRALGVFRHNGVEAIPVPADHQLLRVWYQASWIPSPFNLNASDLAVHEYAALSWYRLSNRI